MIKSFCRNSLVVVLLLASILSLAQKQDRIWLFSDSAGIDFNDLTNPIAINCNLSNPDDVSFTSIASNQGQLLFYSGGVDLTFYSIRVFDKFGNIMQNGDGLRGYPWVCQGQMIIPMPGDTNKYYLFVGNRTGAMGNNIYYNIVDMSLNNHLGSVISKNNLLLTDYVNEKLNAVKHANGRDWWVIVQSTNIDSLFHKFLITPDSILGPFDQYIGSGDNRDKAHGQMIFSKDGNKLGLVAWNSTIDIFDFDRCTGELYNYKQVGEGVTTLENYYHGCSFSPNGNVFYASSIWYEYKNIYQYDLTAPNIKATKQTIFSYQDTGLYSGLEMGQHLLGPDDKIYITKGDGYTSINSKSYYTHHIDVIINPNSLGPSSNYQPSYFDLGRGRTVQGLPTMVNYNLGPVVGSICDSLTNGVKEAIDEKQLFQIYPNPFNDEITIHSLYSINGKLIILDELGKILFAENFTENKTFNLSFLSAGIYFFSIKTEKKIFKEKFVKIK